MRFGSVELGLGFVGLDPARVVELGKLLVKGAHYDRRPGDIVVYKSVGIGLEDVALAHLVYKRCV